MMTCPHCSHRFAPERLLYVATSAVLGYDHRLPEGERRRFLPTMFTTTGEAIDAAHGTCTQTACPECHLVVPRLLATRTALSLSIFGSPGSGKSYLLGAMTRSMRCSAGRLALDFDDVDVDDNRYILSIERRMFDQPSPDHWVWLERTPPDTTICSSVWRGPRRDPRTGAVLEHNRMLLPRPLMFRMNAIAGHPQFGHPDTDRIICLYDNAGEHFQVGGDRYHRVTGHLKTSEGLVFVFDPTQDQSFRRACAERSADLQFRGQAVDQQDALYTNVMNRVVTLRGLSHEERVSLPLVVALTKFDAWRFLLNDEIPAPLQMVDAAGGGSVLALNPHVVEAVSSACRGMLSRLAPRMLDVIENRCDPSSIIYVPVSSTGGPPAGRTAGDAWPFSPEPAPPDGYHYFLAGAVRPLWAEVPLTLLLQRLVPRMIRTVRPAAPA